MGVHNSISKREKYKFDKSGIFRKKIKKEDRVLFKDKNK